MDERLPETRNEPKSPTKGDLKGKEKGKKTGVQSSHATNIAKCVLCSDMHRLCSDMHRLVACELFREKSPTERHEIIRNANLCYICFGDGHRVNECSSMERLKCKRCNGRHNTMLHRMEQRSNSGQQSNALPIRNQGRGQAAQGQPGYSYQGQGYYQGQGQGQIAQGQFGHSYVVQNVPVAASMDNVPQQSYPTVQTTMSHTRPVMQTFNQGSQMVATPNQHMLNPVHMGTQGATGASIPRSTCNQVSFAVSTDKVILLPTAVVKVRLRHKFILARILFDSASQVTLVSERFIKRYGLEKDLESSNTSYNAADPNSFVQCTKACQLSLHSRLNSFSINIVADVAPQLRYQITPDVLQTLANEFPDLQFGEYKLPHNQIDILIGAEYYGKCRINEIRQVGDITLENTQFGWVIMGVNGGSIGSCNSMFCHNITLTSNVTIAEVNRTLEKFWKIEDSAPSKVEETDECTQHFQRHTVRLEDGRFGVRLPFKRNPAVLGESRSRAMFMLKRVERNMDAKTKEMYIEFMREYEALGHMKRVNSTSVATNPYYIPHRAVIRPGSVTTKLRVVFNASAKTVGGPSLNDVLMIGPKVQADLFDILVRFRVHQVAFIADIEKMYRQVSVAKEDWQYQRILWREKPSEEVREYELTTVTYGMAPASFLATQCLQVLGDEIKETSPEASKVIKEDFYMDDLITGSETVGLALQLQRKVHDHLESAKFPLRKYASNCPELLSALPESVVERDRSLSFSSETSVSLLGLSWNPSTDSFGIKLSLSPLPDNLTKREMLSRAASIFDPLGFLSPVTITSKIILQELWKADQGWDVPVENSVANKFTRYYYELEHLKDFSVERQYSRLTNVNSHRLIGFSDASEKAYCAVVYLRCTDVNNCVSVYFVTSRTRVAPLKELTIPRLELQAALLLAELLKRVATNLQLPVEDSLAFTDSMIVLGWLRQSKDNLMVFVRERVRKITEILPADKWNHVPGEENPADLGTRGLTVPQFLQGNLWLKGPSFLCNERYVSESIVDFGSITLPEVCCTMVKRLVSIIDFTGFSNYLRLLRTVAFIVRYVRNTKIPKSQKHSRSLDCLSVSELQAARCVILRETQMDFFSEEVDAVRKGGLIHARSPLSKIQVFLDCNDILRVSTRLTNSPYAEGFRRPIVIHAKSRVLFLYVRHIHEMYFHIGFNSIMTMIRTVFYVIGSLTNVIKSVIAKCVVCTRIRACTQSQVMADLPEDRVTIVRPFAVCGVDFAGPFTTRCTEHRTVKFTKSYLAVFVCFVTRAVHLEVVGNLSTKSFLSCLQRFISRRNPPSRIYSDNATNFVGAEAKLNLSDPEIQDSVHVRNIDWRFITPRAPHHGGIWEAAVKVAKEHLLKATKDQVLTLEEYFTVFTRIEGIMNSRPISYRRQSALSYTVLTPAHFLTGASLIVNFEQAPEPSTSFDLIELCENRRKIVDSFWYGWKADYLSYLQSQAKWCKRKPNVKIGDLVILKEDNVGPSKWPLAVIQEVHPDAKGDVRTVTLRFRDSTKVRPITRLVPLYSEASPPMLDPSGPGICYDQNCI